MELRDFVADALIQISDGISEAIRRSSDINPVFGRGFEEDLEKYVQKVEFDIAVTESDKTAGGGKASVKVLGVFEAGAGGSISSEQGTVSRVKFTVPFIPPVGRRITTLLP